VRPTVAYSHVFSVSHLTVTNLAGTAPTLRAVEDAAGAGELAALVDALPAEHDYLARAMRRRVGALQADPSMALPSMYALCWFDGPKVVRSVLRQWATEWRVRGRGFWLRALRPPILSLDSPLVEEYLGIDDLAMPWFSADGAVVGVRSEQATVAWARATGKRVDVEPPAADPGRYRYVVNNLERTFGVLALKDTTTNETLAIKVDGEPMLTEAVTLPNADVVAGGWLLDYDGLVVRVQPSTGAVVWRAALNDQVFGLRLSPDGSQVLVSFGQGQHTMLSAETGKELASYAPDPGSAAIAPDNRHIAVRGRGTLRVWRPLNPRGAIRPGPTASSALSSRRPASCW